MSCPSFGVNGQDRVPRVPYEVDAGNTGSRKGGDHVSWGGSRKRPQAGRVLGAWRGQDAVHRGAGAAADATPRIEWTFGLRKCRLGTHWRPSFSSSPAWLPPTPRNTRLPGDPSSRPRVWHVRWLRTVSSHTPPAPSPAEPFWLNRRMLSSACENAEGSINRSIVNAQVYSFLEQSF